MFRRLLRGDARDGLSLGSAGHVHVCCGSLFDADDALEVLHDMLLGVRVILLQNHLRSGVRAGVTRRRSLGPSLCTWASCPGRGPGCASSSPPPASAWSWLRERWWAVLWPLWAWRWLAKAS
eukprot:scaffold1023_cov313-Pinguiococcus_pyrenoidosus.AAC.34